MQRLSVLFKVLGCMLFVMPEGGVQASELPAPDYTQINPPAVHIFPIPRKATFERIPLALNDGIQLLDAEATSRTYPAVVQDLAESLESRNVPLIDDGPAAVLLAIGVEGDAAVQRHALPDAIGAQGYAIRFDRQQKTFHVIGRDPAGLLYGVQSFVQLIRLRGGNRVIYPADVDDWPQFLWRATGNSNYEREAWIPRMKWMVRLRFTHSLFGGDWDDEEETKNQYTLARNLRLGPIGSYYISVPYPDHTCIMSRMSNNCWTDEKVRQGLLQSWGQYARSGMGLLSWHDHTDAGRWSTYIDLWANRCSRCKKEYPQATPARADADRFAMIYEELQRHNPDAHLLLTLPCYFDFPENNPAMHDYLREVGDALPRNGKIWFILEQRPPASAAAYRELLGHPIVCYLYSEDRSPFAAKQYVGNFAEEDMFLYLASHRTFEEKVMVSAQFNWNPHLPDNDQYALTELYPRAFEYFYGEAWRGMATWAANKVDWATVTETQSLETLEQARDRVRRVLPVMRRDRDKLPPQDQEARASFEENVELAEHVYLAAALRSELIPLVRETDRALRCLELKDFAGAMKEVRSAEQRLARIDRQILNDDASIQRIKQTHYRLIRAIPLIHEAAVRNVAWLREQTMSRVPAMTRAPLFQIGRFDGSDKEFEGGKADKSDFQVGREPEVNFPSRSTFESSRRVHFEGDLTEGALLVVGYMGDDFDVALNGQALGSFYTTPTAFRQAWMVLPPTAGQTHTLEFTIRGKMNFEAVALFTGRQPVPEIRQGDYHSIVLEDWSFRADPENRGLEEKWFSGASFDGWRVLPVPGRWEHLDGLKHYDGYGWYAITFSIPEQWRDQRIILHVGSCDDEAWVYVNGQLVGDHRQADHPATWWIEPFSFDITDAVRDTNAANTLVIRVLDLGGEGGLTGRVELRPGQLKDGPGQLQ